MIAVFLANGFEEIEALAVVDVLRRAELDVATIAVGCTVPVGAHGIAVQPDLHENSLDFSTLEAMVLPGGMPGTLNLEQSDVVQKALRYAMDRNLVVGAICAAPSILGHKGYLNGLRATCYPGFESSLEGAILTDGVVTDGNVTTGCGPGVAVEFALELVSRLLSSDTSDSIREAMQCL